MLGAMAALGACATLWLGNQALQESCAGGSTDGDSSAGTGDVEPCVDGNYRLFFVSAFLFGLGDCAIQSNTSAICADEFGGRSAEAFALYRTFQAAMSCSLFFLTPLWSTDEGKVATANGLVIEIVVVAANLLLALLGWAVFDCLPRDREKANARAASTTREPVLR